VPVTIRAAAFRTRCSLLVTLFDAPTRIMLPESTRDVTVRDAYGRLSSYSVLIGVKLTASISADRRQAKCVDRMDQSQVSWLSRSVVAVDRSLSPTWMTLGSTFYTKWQTGKRSNKKSWISTNQVKASWCRHSSHIVLTFVFLYESYNKKLSCRRDTAQRFVSLNILLSHSMLLKLIRNDTVE